MAEKLLTWRQEDLEGFNAQLSLGKPKTLQLIKAIEEWLVLLERDIKTYRYVKMRRKYEELERCFGSLKELHQMLRGEREWEYCFVPCNNEELKERISNPY